MEGDSRKDSLNDSNVGAPVENNYNMDVRESHDKDDDIEMCTESEVSDDYNAGALAEVAVLNTVDRCVVEGRENDTKLVLPEVEEIEQKDISNLEYEESNSSSCSNANVSSTSKQSSLPYFRMPNPDLEQFLDETDKNLQTPEFIQSTFQAPQKTFEADEDSDIEFIIEKDKPNDHKFSRFADSEKGESSQKNEGSRRHILHKQLKQRIEQKKLIAFKKAKQNSKLNDEEDIQFLEERKNCPSGNVVIKEPKKTNQNDALEVNLTDKNARSFYNDDEILVVYDKKKDTINDLKNMPASDHVSNQEDDIQISHQKDDSKFTNQDESDEESIIIKRKVRRLSDSEDEPESSEYYEDSPPYTPSFLENLDSPPENEVGEDADTDSTIPVEHSKSEKERDQDNDDSIMVVEEVYSPKNSVNKNLKTAHFRRSSGLKLNFMPMDDLVLEPDTPGCSDTSTSFRHNMEEILRNPLSTPVSEFFSAEEISQICSGTFKPTEDVQDADSEKDSNLPEKSTTVKCDEHSIKINQSFGDWKEDCSIVSEDCPAEECPKIDKETDEKNGEKKTIDSQLRVNDFLDDEAELSGDDDGIEDDQEDQYHDDDIQSLIVPDHEVEDDEKVRDAVVELHVKKMHDDDQELLKQVKETYLDNGELDDGSRRAKSFFWQNTEMNDNFHGQDSESDSEKEADNDENTTLQNKEKAKWLQERKNDDLSKIDFSPRESSMKIDIVKGSDILTEKTGGLKRSSGSFLNRKDEDKERLLKKAKTDEEDAGAKTTKHFIFTAPCTSEEKNELSKNKDTSDTPDVHEKMEESEK